MAHALDFTTGRAGIAYVGETPWHGLGQALTPGAALEVWQQEAGLDWECKAAPVMFEREALDLRTGLTTLQTEAAPGNRVLYRSDSGAPLSVVSDRYRPVQPRDVIEFYRDLTERFGFQLETAGSLKGGRKIWALANTRNAFQLGADRVGGYLLLATSFDGSMATQARFTSVRVVCNNTISIATQGRADVTVRHSTDFDASKVKTDLRIGEDWAEFERSARAMAQRPMAPEQSVRFLLDVYHGLTTDDQIRAAKDDAAKAKSLEKFIGRMQTALFNSPGAHMESARGMLWGVLNAVTYDIDHAAPSHNRENRLDKAWFGTGETIKARALEKALALL